MYYVQEMQFKNGAIYISARSDNRTPDQVTQSAFASDKLICTSELFESLREHLLHRVVTVFEVPSKSEAESKRKVLVDFYRNNGHTKVLNIKK